MIVVSVWVRTPRSRWWVSQCPILLFYHTYDEQSPQGSNPQGLGASVILPPEILDKILEYIPANNEGRSTLIACSSVATWWAGSSQRRLFSSVLIHEDNYQRWMNGVVLFGLKARLLEHVRSLWHRRGVDFRVAYRMRDLPKDSGEYLSALHNIRSLTLCMIEVEHVGGEGFRTCFSAFREALTHLSLDIFITSFSAFVALVDYFPNIRILQLRLLNLERDNGPIPTLSRPLRGKLYVQCVQDYSLELSLEFYNQFAKLEQEYEELTIDPYSLSSSAKTKFLDGALQISTATIKLLRLTDEFRGEWPSTTLRLNDVLAQILHALTEGAPTISDFRQLRELELVVIWPSPPHKVPLPSITSTKLRKVVFRVKYVLNSATLAQGRERWALIDEQLRGLVDQLCAAGYPHILEAELRFAKVVGHPVECNLADFLPEFRKKGIVTVIDENSGDCLHTFTHSC